MLNRACSSSVVVVCSVVVVVCSVVVAVVVGNSGSLLLFIPVAGWYVYGTTNVFPIGVVPLIVFGFSICWLLVGILTEGNRESVCWVLRVLFDL